MSAKNIFDDIGHGVKKAAEDAGKGIADGAKDTGKGIKLIRAMIIDPRRFRPIRRRMMRKHDASAAATHGRHNADKLGKDVEDAIAMTTDERRSRTSATSSSPGLTSTAYVGRHPRQAGSRPARKRHAASLEARFRKKAWNSLNSMKHSAQHEVEVAGSSTISALAEIKKDADRTTTATSIRPARQGP